MVFSDKSFADIKGVSELFGGLGLVIVIASYGFESPQLLRTAGTAMCLVGGLGILALIIQNTMRL